MALPSAELERVRFRPFFQDALSGAFVPARDPHRAHTLSRLAMATLMKGEEADSVDETLAQRYVPSWAPGVEVTTTYTEDHGYPLVEAVTLLREDSPRVLIACDVDFLDESQGLLLVTDVGKNRELPLEPGPDLVVAQGLVTIEAKRFFDARSTEL